MQTIELLKGYAELAMQCGVLILLGIVIYWAFRWTSDEIREAKESREYKKKLKDQYDNIKSGK